MSAGRRPHVGFEVRCDARGCRATTATTAPAEFRRTEALALQAARASGWLSTRIAGETVWACPMHQLWDQRLGRWVTVPALLTA